MRGRKPKPTALKVLEGNPGKRALNPHEPEPPALVPIAEPPAELLMDRLAIEEWNRIAPMLGRIRLVSDADRTAMIAVCLEWSRYVTASQKVLGMGMIVKAPSGYPIPNPYLPIVRASLVLCIKLWTELGMTPSSRSRVTTVGPGVTPDAFSEFDEPPVFSH